MAASRAHFDPLTSATVTTTWVVAANKPFYPIYIWWLVGSGIQASLGTLVALPFLLAIPRLARVSPLAARMALPIVGTLDTIFATKLFGQASGTELFLAPCIMLAALSFTNAEKWFQRGLAVSIFCAFALARNFLGDALQVWTDADLRTLLDLNAFAVACLTTFIAIRYAGISR
ncbi:hypothetical protein [Rhizobium sp. RAF56]|uniref:hypothetical protein n=1 Tax=Rhizobium sp. RAF56 TaxID=3233062 RepID=UPI003F988634